MIVEQRTYTLKAGAMPQYLALYEREGFDVQSKHLGEPVGYYFSETGVLNQITHLWQYEDASDRQRRRIALYANPSWQSVVERLLSLIEKMETQLLVPAPFFKPRRTVGRD